MLDWLHAGICLSITDVDVLQGGAAQQGGVVPNDAVVNFQVDEFLAVLDGVDVLHLRPGQNQVFQVGHIGDEINGLDGGVPQIDAHHVLAIAQGSDVLLLEIVLALVNGHELCLVGARLTVGGKHHRPHHLILAADFLPVGGHLLVVNAAAVHNQLLKLGKAVGNLFGLVNAADGRVGDVNLCGIVPKGLAKEAHIPVNADARVFRPQLQQLCPGCIGVVNGQGLQLGHGGKPHVQLGICRAGDLQLHVVCGEGRAADGLQIFHLPLGVGLFQLLHQGKFLAASAIYFRQAGHIFQIADIGLGQTAHRHGGGIGVIKRTGNGNLIAEGDIGVFQVCFFQRGIVRAAAGIHGFQVGEIAQASHIAVGESGDGDFGAAAVKIVPGHGHAPDDVGAGDFPAQGFVFCRGDGLIAQVQGFLILREQLSAQNHVVFQKKIADCQNNSQSNHQNGCKNGTNHALVSHVALLYVPMHILCS